jgi:tetratricopeptide (TPR) repeat protein
MGKGFGKNILTGKARQFFDAFQNWGRAEGGFTKAHDFFQVHLSELDESLLEAMPLLFEQLIDNQSLEKRQKIAALFGIFGTTIQDFPLGDRQINLELSLQAYQLILKVFSRRLFPEQWAGTQNNLANAYSERIKGDRADNIEQAIRTYDLALEVRRRENFPEDWATTQNNLANAYKDRIKGDRTENIESAIIAYQLALEVYRRDAFPEDWAMTQNNLANAYKERIKGDRAENIESAIIAYQLALKVYRRDAFPEKWAGTQNNLANAYSERIKGDRADNIEQAIRAYDLALEVYRCENFPEKWAMTQNNLANAYKERIKGDRAENIESAIIAYQLVLKVYRRDAFPEDWAGTQNNLANAYKERIKGDRAENIESAIIAYQQAAQVFTRDAFPLKYAGSQSNLAESILQRALLMENATDFDVAIKILESALEVEALGSPNFIDSQYRLGNASFHRYEYSKNAADLQAAIQAYKIALEAISPEHYDRQKIWQALPTTQAILGSRLVREGKWQEGLQLLLNSLNQLRPINHGDDRIAYANALFLTGRAYESLTDWGKARLYYGDAIRYYESLDDRPGMARSYEGLGGVFVSQGHLDKGSSYLQKAQAIYEELPKLADNLGNVYNLLEIAQRAIDRQALEILA